MTENHDYDDKKVDVIDQASAIEMRRNEGLIDEARKRASQVRKPDPDGSYPDTECDECGAEIPLERMRVAPRNDLCVHCLEEEEHRNRFLKRKD